MKCTFCRLLNRIGLFQLTSYTLLDFTTYNENIITYYIDFNVHAHSFFVKRSIKNLR